MIGWPEERHPEPEAVAVIENTPVAWSERAAREASWEAALWSEHGQTQRFLALMRQLDLREGDTLLDFGAGTGRLCEFLPQSVTYYAYDSAPGMLERIRIEHPRAWVLEELPEELFDHVVCVGPFNLTDGWSRERTFETLLELWAMQTRRTLAVSLYRGDDPHALRYDVDELAAFASRLTHSFVIDCSYLSNDVLAVLHR